jgi:hypothetical protein
VLHRRAKILYSPNISSICKRLVDVPRFLPFVRDLDISQSKRRPLNLDFEADVATLLSKLPNLISLAILVSTSIPYWRRCGKIFQNCTFRLSRLVTSFFVDEDLIAFLERQPGISIWETSSWIEENCAAVPKSLLPKLSVLAHKPRFSEYTTAFVLQILDGRSITHLMWDRGLARDSQDIPPLIQSFRSCTVPLLAFKAGLDNPSLYLRSLLEFCPLLEYLGTIFLEGQDASFLCLLI